MAVKAEDATTGGMDDVEATFEELAQLELEFEDLDTQMIAHQYLLAKPLYTKRSAIIKKIRNFWPLAFEQAPPDVDQLIQPTDSEVFATSLLDFAVERFEIPSDASVDAKNFGNPRSVSFKFEFTENEWFTDKVLEKKFYWRRARDGFAGYISEPVKINWKEGKDLTQGLLDAAIVFSDAVKARGDTKVNINTLKESRELSKKVERSTEGSQSFFTWFGHIGRFISADESKIATAKFEEKRQKAKEGGGKISMEDEQDTDQIPLQIVENDIFPDGAELANILANEFWPEALSFFTSAQDDDGQDDFEEYDDDMDDDEEDDDAPIDIRSLVKDEQRSDGPPAKKRRT